jgi:hypothetical protein
MKEINPNALRNSGKQMLIWIDKEGVEKLEKISKETNLSMAEIIRQAIKKLE